ncbi:MAG: trimeric intracellular cation channel family protein [Planctomycetaceae bacterium]
MDEPFLLPPALDYLATFLWGLSGALLAARRGYAPLGLFTLALVSGTGGGLLRDALFIQGSPPVLVRDPWYLWISTAAGALVLVFGRKVQQIPRFSQVVAVVDALGLGTYAVVGMDRAYAAGLSLAGAIMVGMVNATGGGLLRDVLMRQEPSLLKPGTLEESAAFAGCLTYAALTHAFGQEQFPSACWTIAFVFVLRLLAIRYAIRSQPLRDFKADWGPSTPDKR